MFLSLHKWSCSLYNSKISLFCCYNIYLFCWYNIHDKYNFITLRDWHISNSFEIPTILGNTCVRIRTLTFCQLMIIFTFTLICFIIPFLIWITYCSIDFAFKMTWNMFYHFFGFILFVIILNALTCRSFVSFGTNMFGEKTLQLPVYLFNLIISIFISIIVI